MTVILPQDIVEQIISHVYPNINSLRTCALIANAWYLPSRILLHSRFDFVGTHRSIERLRYYIDHPDLLECVQTLSINVPQPVWRDRWHGHDTVEFSFSSLLDAHFPRVSTREIRFFNHGRAENAEILSYFKTCLPFLTSLSIQNSDIPSHELNSLITSFPRLSSLSIHKVSSESEDSNGGRIGQAMPIGTLMRLRHLETDMGAGSVFIKLIENLPVKPPISHVRIYWDGRGSRRNLMLREASFTKDVFACTRGTLRSLSIRDHRNKGDIKNSIGLGDCKQLCRVELGVTFAHTAHWVQDILSDLIFDSLDEIVIRLRGISVLSNNYVNDIIETYAPLDEFLIAKKRTLGDDFPVMKIILRHSHRRHFPLDGILEALGKIFPQCLGSELLEVQYERV
ncbi:unnamed protein product [Somion occarium]|uniref:F-box domain-containing protein n=1 Tax=Somion occarium TaxID=3059160 RepID=A0ABP1DFA6_9APHY